MRNEDEFIYEGIIYSAVVPEGDDECEGCVGEHSDLCMKLPACSEIRRMDGRCVMWIKTGEVERRHRRNA